MATLLAIDDSDSDRKAIRKVVERSRVFDRILEASDGVRGLKLLLAEPVDVVLCDLEMPGIAGEKLLHVRSARPDKANVPFLFLTASTNAERRARLLEEGACDAITKPFHPADLIARLRLHLKVKWLQDELREKNASLERLATMDQLTGLRTRRYALEVLTIEFLRARRYHTPLTVMMADLDHFKAVNDRFGHPAGDAVLRGVADILQDSLRTTDVAGRYGGEELMVVLTHNNTKGAETLAERWRRNVEHASFETSDGGLAHVTISIGIAENAPSFESPEALVAAADKGLYVAKKLGRNRIEVYEG